MSEKKKKSRVVLAVKSDPAKPAAARHDHHLEHRLDPGAERQIGVADDAGADLGLAIGARCRHRRDAVGELDLADRAQLNGPAGAIHRQPFEIDRGRDVVAAAGIGQQIGQQVAAGILAIDQMMVRIDDRQIGVEDLLLASREPVRAHPQMRAGRRRRIG